MKMDQISDALVVQLELLLKKIYRIVATFLNQKSILISNNTVVKRGYKEIEKLDEEKLKKLILT